MLLVRARTLARLFEGHPIDEEKSAGEIYQTMFPRPGWNQRKWIDAEELAAGDQIDDGYTIIMGPALEMRADWIYHQEL